MVREEGGVIFCTSCGSDRSAATQCRSQSANNALYIVSMQLSITAKMEFSRCVYVNEEEKKESERERLVVPVKVCVTQAISSYIAFIRALKSTVTAPDCINPFPGPGSTRPQPLDIISLPRPSKFPPI